MIRFLTANLGWKILSFSLAALLWLAFVNEPEMTTTLTAPVLYRNLQDGLEITSGGSDSVRLEVKGPVGKLSPQYLAGAAVTLDLTETKRPGERTFSVRHANTVLPFGVTLVRSVPAQLRLQLERVVSEEVTVQVRFANAPPPACHIASQEVTPPRLRISGPESRVSQIESVQTDPIDVSNVTAEAVFDAHAYVGDPHVRFDGPSTVRVKVVCENAR